MKICLACNKDFVNRNYNQKFCSKKCSRKINGANFYQKNKIKRSKENAEMPYEEKQILLEYKRQYRQSDKGKTVTKLYLNNPIIRKKRNLQSRVRTKKKYDSDPVYKTLRLMRSRLVHALNGELKADNTIKLIGCTSEFLKEYLEKQFRPGMTWKNHTVKGWHVDHIIPCDSFDFSDAEQQKECFHYTNLQPLWYDENLRKKNKIL